MKRKIFTLCLTLTTLCLCWSSQTHAQSISYNDYGNSCYFNFDSIFVSVTGAVSGEQIEIFYGDGSSDTRALSVGGGSGFTGFGHPYASAGTYTVKIVLVSAAGAGIDSVIYTNNYSFCQQINLYAYNDVNGNCTFDLPADDLIYYDAARVEIDSASHILDTVSLAYWASYQAHGPIGTPYAFKLVHNPYGFLPSCPAGGIIYDTVSGTPNSSLYFGFTCDPTVGVDNAVSGHFSAGLMGAWSWAEVTSTSCSSVPLTLAITNSPKYAVSAVYFTGSATPVYTVSGNVVSISLPSVSTTDDQWVSVYYTAVGTLTLGDTVNTRFSLTPLTGDINTANNTELLEDTIRASYDPNEKSVYPSGNITAGTNLEYMITFENTGNDTAHNIHVLDTLSGNVDVNSIKIISTGAKMNMSLIQSGGYNIVKFDFPAINLLDSSHHGQCTSGVTFSVNSKTGLANGTKIDNKAGIYFDDNTVVMTNNVENIIGIPAGTQTISNVSDAVIFPNPANNELIVKLMNSKYNNLVITNTLGQLMMKQDMSNVQTSVNISALPSGIYFITLKGESGTKTMQFEKL